MTHDHPMGLFYFWISLQPTLIAVISPAIAWGVIYVLTRHHFSLIVAVLLVIGIPLSIPLTRWHSNGFPAGLQGHSLIPVAVLLLFLDLARYLWPPHKLLDPNLRASHFAARFGVVAFVNLLIVDIVVAWNGRLDPGNGWPENLWFAGIGGAGLWDTLLLTPLLCALAGGSFFTLLRHSIAKDHFRNLEDKA